MEILQRILFLGLQVMVLVSCLVTTGKADWINLSGSENSRNISEIYVERDHVKVKLEIFVQDLKIFEELIPDRLLNKPQEGRPGVAERVRQFAEQKFTITTGLGKKLSAELVLAEPRMRVKRPSPFAGKINPITRQPILGPPADKRVLYVELIYPFSGKPQTLTFTPPVDDNGAPTASIGFVCYHEGVMVIDFRQLAPNTTLNLDWEDPWYSSFSQKQFQRSLQSGFRTFLYIEPYEVRNEILVRVKDMMNWVDFDLQGNKYIEENEFDSVRQKIAQLFMSRQNVLIDGKQLKPILDRTAYVESSMSRSRFIEVPERVPLNTAMVGIIITYLTDGIPQEVETRWDLFSDRIQKVMASMIDPAGPFPYDLEPGDNVLRWTNYLKNYTIPTVEQVKVDARHRGIRVPLISLAFIFGIVVLGFSALLLPGTRKNRKLKAAILAGLLIGACVSYPYAQVPIGRTAQAELIDDQELPALVLSVLKNIYRAFDFREEEDVFDKLAISVSGDLLTDIYLQSRTSLQIEQAGGAQAKVKQIEILETSAQQSLKEKGAVDIRAKWSAAGVVGHWGHLHTRQNVYDAILTIAVVNENWKLVGLELLDEKRVAPFATLSGSNK